VSSKKRGGVKEETLYAYVGETKEQKLAVAYKRESMKLN